MIRESTLPYYTPMTAGLGQDDSDVMANGNGTGTGNMMGTTTFRNVNGVMSLVGLAAGVYHGMRRTGAWGAVGYGLLGSFWPVGIPVMLAQGYAKPKR